MKKLKLALFAVCACVLGLGASLVTAQAKDADGDIVIVIDAGHGGTDPGKIATTGAEEADINLVIATAFRDELMKYEGVKVYLTRSDDFWITNTGRSMIAAALKADFLISCHNNSADPSASGALVIGTVNPYHSQATNEMANHILNNLAELGLNNGGIMTRPDDTFTYEDYYTLIGEGVRVGVPSIIIEHCFLSNENDALFVSNADASVNVANCKSLGVADARAVATYYNLVKRTAEADGEKVLTLLKGYSVQAKTPTADINGVTWYSLDASVATVTEDGVVTAVNTGTANIAYKLVTGETGTLTIQVLKTEPVAISGALDPTFYDEGKFGTINLGNVFGVMINNDGTAQKIAPTVMGTVDYNKSGIQDIPITYNGLNGFVRVINREGYTPEVTMPEPEEETDAPEEETPTETMGESESDASNEGDEYVHIKKSTLIKVLIVVFVLIVIGIVILILEKTKSSRRRRRSRRYY